MITVAALFRIHHSKIIAFKVSRITCTLVLVEPLKEKKNQGVLGVSEAFHKVPVVLGELSDLF